MRKPAKATSLLLSIIAILFLSGCGGGADAQTGRVAIIDLDAIAAATGKSKEIRDAIAGLAKQRETELTQLQTDLIAKVDAEKDKLGKKPSAKQQQSLTEMALKARQELQQNIALAKQQTQQLRVKLINDFKQEILPVAVKIATQKNYSVVLVKGPSLFYIDSNADITSAVIAELNQAAK